MKQKTKQFIRAALIIICVFMVYSCNADSTSDEITDDDYIGTFSRTFIDSGETKGAADPGDDVKETCQIFNGDGTTLDYNEDGTVDITYESGTMYGTTTTCKVINGVEEILWKSIFKVVSPTDLSDATVFVVYAQDSWHTSGGWYDNMKSGINSVTNSLSSDKNTLTQTSAEGTVVNTFTRE